jgi:arsenate reductase
MKVIMSIGIVALCCAGCRVTPKPPSNADFVEPLRPYVSKIANELNRISPERKVLLAEIAVSTAARLESGEDANLTFICTHNSRRSHMSQIWAQTAAYYYGLDRVYAFSGGTEATACNCRTVSAMRRVGFSIVNTTDGDNPVYLIQYSDARPPVRAYSKLYNADENPKQDFIALMTCSQADRKCPTVEGAVARYAIHYVDPKLCDDTPDEASAYNARCREIAREMFYIMLEVRKRLDGTIVKPSG